MPVIADGEIVGLINETDLLEHMLGEGGRDEPIDELVETQFTIVESDDRVDMIGEFFKHNKVVIVVDEADEPIGIVTKIDFIDYMSDHM